jgi:hypothetical protein
LFGYGESVIDLNAEIPDGALDLGTARNTDFLKFLDTLQGFLWSE